MNYSFDYLGGLELLLKLLTLLFSCAEGVTLTSGMAMMNIPGPERAVSLCILKTDIIAAVVTKPKSWQQIILISHSSYPRRKCWQQIVLFPCLGNKSYSFSIPHTHGQSVGNKSYFFPCLIPKAKLSAASRTSSHYWLQVCRAFGCILKIVTQFSSSVRCSAWSQQLEG